jgi:osmoprotectant transport system substrate-binding protein
MAAAVSVVRLLSARRTSPSRASSARSSRVGSSTRQRSPCRAGGIDLYVEYTGTAFTAILQHPPITNPDSVRRAVASEYGRRWAAEWSAPLGFENTFAILVRRSTADSLNLRTISDAVPHATRWTAGFGYEFTEREDGLPGLELLYGLRFGRDPRLMDLGLLYRALANGLVDLVAGNSTDGQIAALDLVMLEDDRRYFPPYEAAPSIPRRCVP